jgi:hypothetical protein
VKNEGIGRGPLIRLPRGTGRSTNQREVVEEVLRVETKPKLTREVAVMSMTGPELQVARNLGVDPVAFAKMKETNDEVPGDGMDGILEKSIDDFPNVDEDGDDTDQPMAFLNCKDCQKSHMYDRHAGELAECVKCRARHGERMQHGHPDSDSIEPVDRSATLSPEQKEVNQRLGIGDSEFARRTK